MRKLVVLVSIAVLAGLALPSFGMGLGLGTFEYCGYTITITPTDPEHPGQSGTITIEGESEYATVSLQGTYEQTAERPPTLNIHMWGTITTPEASYEVDKEFSFAPQTRRMVWRQIVAWIESIIEA